ncbi:MAG: hypothetical protein IEMM0002_0044 [bacterium]|nr:MAG: hypothetical protein IEMM0002_0044 [bacterium]
MEVRARVRYVRMSPQKGRLVADMVRGKKVSEALNILRFTNKATAKVIGKLIASAKSNAEVKNVADPEEMKVETIYVDAGPFMKRRLARARGRVDVINKPFSHVTVILHEVEEKPKKAEGAKKAATKKTASSKKKAVLRKTVKDEKASEAATGKKASKKEKS